MQLKENALLHRLKYFVVVSIEGFERRPFVTYEWSSTWNSCHTSSWREESESGLIIKYELGGVKWPSKIFQKWVDGFCCMGKSLYDLHEGLFKPCEPIQRTYKESCWVNISWCEACEGSKVPGKPVRQKSHNRWIAFLHKRMKEILWVGRWSPTSI